MPAACAVSSRNCVVVPADQGPAVAPQMPRPARAARSSSVSNHSATKSATAIGPQRRTRVASLRPRPRKPRPRPRSGNTSATRGSSRSGGAMVRTLRQHAADPAQAGRELRPRLRVLLGVPRDLGRGLRGVAEEGQALAVGRARVEPGLGLQELHREAEVADERGPERAGQVGHGRGPEAGMELLGDRAAAHGGAALEDQRLLARLGEQGGGGEAVDASAHDDDVGPHATFPRLQSFRISSAPRRPGAAMMPPPGWVAEPQM